MADYKLLDPNRKVVLRLPHLAFKLWMTYFMSESDDQEAYLSNEVIAERSGLSENTIIKWRKWLVKHGWLRPCGGTAAERYSKATRGAHQVLIYRVDDPTEDATTSSFEEDAELPTANLEGDVASPAGVNQNVIPPKFADKVYGSVSASRYGSGSASSYATDTCCKPVSDLASLRSDEKQQQEQQQKQKPRRLRLVHKYDAPFPEGFNDDPSEVGVKFRSEWCEAHRLDRDASSRSNPEKASGTVSEPEVPALPPVVELAPPMSPKPSHEPDEPVKVTVKASVLSATPTPPSSSPPPAPAPAVSVAEDWRTCHMKRLAEEVYVLQQHFNPTPEPRMDWDTAWLPEIDALVQLTEGKGSMNGWMLDDVIALSQVRYATKYATPAAIFADVLTLGREVAELRTEGTFAEVRNAYFKVVYPPEQQSDEDERRDKPTMWVDPEVKAERERKDLAKLIMRWNTWLDAHTQQQKMA